MAKDKKDFHAQCVAMLNSLQQYEDLGHECKWLQGMAYAWTAKLIGATKTSEHVYNNAADLTDDARRFICDALREHDNCGPDRTMAAACIRDGIITLDDFIRWTLQHEDSNGLD